MPIGAITGIMPAAEMVSITRRSIASGAPTKPRSIARSILLSGSRLVRATLAARTKPPSLPEMPTARPPAAAI
jgi:hypothetical protein